MIEASAHPFAPRISARLALASMIGTSLEWYDFMIYNTTAALVFNSIFFPTSTPLVGLLLSFSTYAVGYLSRPFGSLVFGRLGDLLGRRSTLVLTLVLMGLGTSLIAVLPTYREIGILSPALLVASRLLQGIALGGEWAGAVLLAMEHGGTARRGLNSSWAQMGPAAGTLLSSGVIALVTFVISDKEFAAWGWRLPFASSALVVLFGLWVRVGVDESPAFRAMQARQEVAAAPLREVLSRHRRALLVAGAARIGPDVVYALLVVFSVAYLTSVLGLSRPLALGALMAGSALNMIAIPAFGLLIDRIGTRAVYGAGIATALPLAFCFFPLLRSRSAPAIVLAVAIGMIVHAAMYAAQSTFIVERFAPSVRYTGASIAYTFGSLAAGGAFAPLIMTSLLKATRSTFPIALYVVTALLATGAAVLFASNAPDPTRVAQRPPVHPPTGVPPT